MPSSISSSERLSSRRLVGLFLVGLFGMGLAAEWLPPGHRIEIYTWQRHTWLDDSWFLPRFDGRYDFFRGDFLEHARTADILILGNSRTMFAFRQEFLAPFTERTGLRFFNLGFGYREGWSFAREIIRRHDLRPPIVLVNADNFFGTGMSHFARQVMTEAANLEQSSPLERWQATTSRFEEESRRRIQIWIQGLIPRWTLAARGDEWRVHRSREDGSWLMKGFDLIESRQPIAAREPSTDILGILEPGEIAALEDFRSEMQGRGSKIVITRVPSHETVPQARSRHVAQRLDTDFVEPTVSCLETFDRSHMTRASSRRFMAGFLDEFEQLTSVQELIDRPDQ